MKRRLGIIALLTLALVWMGVGGYAMPLTAGDGTITLSATTLEGEPYALETSELNLMGRDAVGYLISSNGMLLRVSAANLSVLAEALDSAAINALPTLKSYETTLARGERGEQVAALQQKLIQAGYLTGSADGDYGGQTQRAVTALQQAGGLEATGDADAYTQMLLDSMIQEPVALSERLVSGGRFSNITENSNADLSAAAERGLALDFDDLAGTGFISNGNEVTYSVDAEADIDKCDFTLRFGINVRENNDGSFTVEPALLISGTGVRRPLMQEVTLKSGSQRYTLGVSDVKSELAGIASKETATVLLDREVAGMLAKADEAGELKLRVTCRDNAFDIEVPEDQLALIADVGYAALGV